MYVEILTNKIQQGDIFCYCRTWPVSLLNLQGQTNICSREVEYCIFCYSMTVCCKERKQNESDSLDCISVIVKPVPIYYSYLTWYLLARAIYNNSNTNPMLCLNRFIETILSHWISSLWDNSNEYSLHRVVKCIKLQKNSTYLELSLNHYYLPPIESATFQSSARVQRARVKTSNLVGLKLLESLSTVFQLWGHHIEGLVYPGYHLVGFSKDGRTDTTSRYSLYLLKLKT